ncbi:MAG TPA: hypothetical protein VFO46_25360 [Candidatus Sulfotelmatobacter sp.]|nr:hypothetical protein [Candidatus Sulfotelmatobacter sp.]
MRNSKYFIFVIVLSCAGAAAQVSPTMPPPNRNIAGPSAHTSPGVHPESVAGTIEGFVYWDVNTVRHTPANSCSGLAITVSVGSSSGGPFTAYTPLRTLSNNFKYVGQVKEFLAGGKVNVYDVCTYGFAEVPVGPPLQVKLTLTQPTAFSPLATPQFEILGPITIINGQCNMLPRIDNPTLSDLVAHWGSCQDVAYDVNFVMLNPHATALGGAGAVSGTGNVRATPNSSGNPLLKNPGPGGTPMLSGGQQQGMLAKGAPATAQSSSTNGGAQHSETANTEVTRQSAAGTTPGATSQTLTNADVAKMLEAGLAESVIISSIRSARKNFDFSPAGCQTLKRARVSVSILAAMGEGGVRPCGEIAGNPPSATPGSKVELNPQPLPPGSKTAPANRTALKPIKLAAPKALRKTTNPRLAERSASIIAILQQQRAAAQEEAAAMKLGIRSAASAASVRAPLATTFQGGTTVQNLGPETTQSEKGNLAARMVHAPFFNSIPLLCANDPTPRIIQLSGGEGHGILTPESKYNLYTITGCSFGPPDAGNSAYIFAVNGFNANLNIDFWSDNGITVHLDSWLAGVLDQDNVTVVVAPAGKQPFNKSGYKFYAARGMPAPDGSDQDVTLAYNSMPNASVSLFDASPVLAGYDQVPPNGTSQFPSFSFQGTPVAGWVFRYAYGHQDPYEGVVTSCFINDVAYQFRDASDPCGHYFYAYWQKPLGSDTWDFSKLVPGFVISAYDLYYEDTDPTQLCGSWDDSSKNSGLLLNWDFNLTAPAQISVTWPLYWCQDEEAWPGARTNEQKQSAYGLAVWVLGPRCVDPWTGQKDQVCMNKVKQTLS